MRGPVFFLIAAGALLSLSACSQQSPEAQRAELSASPPAVATQQPTPANIPESAKGQYWQYIVNNALRTAGEYAADRNPSAAFVGPGLQTDFIKQVAGEHKGRYLLHVVNNHGGDTSFAVLLPLFDENASSDSLDDNGKLWKVISAKYNGRKF